MAYNRFYFWSKSNKNKIEYLKKIETQFNSYNDCSIGNIHFHKKLRLIDENDKLSEEINENEIFKRLKLTYKLLGFRFFAIYEIKMLSYEDFFNFNYQDKCSYVEYIYNKIFKILDNLVDTFTLFEYVKEQMEHLKNPVPIKIEMDIFTSEIEDMDF